MECHTAIKITLTVTWPKWESPSTLTLSEEDGNRNAGEMGESERRAAGDTHEPGGLGPTSQLSGPQVLRLQTRAKATPGAVLTERVGNFPPAADTPQTVAVIITGVLRKENKNTPQLSLGREPRFIFYSFLQFFIFSIFL